MIAAPDGSKSDCGLGAGKEFAADKREAKELQLLSEISHLLLSLTHVQSKFYEKSDILAEDGS